MSEIPEIRVQRNKPSFAILFATSGLLLIAFIFVGIVVSWTFGWVGVESYTGSELYSKIVNGQVEARRVAAMDWAQQLSKEGRGGSRTNPKLLPSKSETESLGQILNSPPAGREADLTFLSALTSILSFSEDAQGARGALVKFLETHPDPNDLSQSQIYALLGLARTGLAEESEAKVVLDRSKSLDPALRKTAAYVLGDLLNQKPTFSLLLKSSLVEMLSDAVDDVRWNASFALARNGDGSGLKVLRTVLEDLKSAPPESLTPDRFELFDQALKVSAKLKAPELRDLINQIAQNESNLKLRETAKESQY